MESAPLDIGWDDDGDVDPKEAAAVAAAELADELDHVAGLEVAAGGDGPKFFPKIVQSAPAIPQIMTTAAASDGPLTQPASAPETKVTAEPKLKRKLESGPAEQEDVESDEVQQPGATSATDSAVDGVVAGAGSAELDGAVERRLGAETILPANPFGELADESLEAFIECTIYEEAVTQAEAAEEPTTGDGAVADDGKVALAVATDGLTAEKCLAADLLLMQPKKRSIPVGWAVGGAAAVLAAGLLIGYALWGGGQEGAVESVASVAKVNAKKSSPAELTSVADSKVAKPAQAKIDADAKDDADPKALAGAKAQANADAKAQANADAKAQANADAKAQANADAKAQADADANAQADAKSQADAAAKSQADADAKAAAAMANGSGCAVSVETGRDDTVAFVGDTELGTGSGPFPSPCGEVKLRIEHPRYQTFIKTVSASPGAPTVVKASLKRPTFSLKVRSSPSGATVWVNGRTVGRSPVSVSVTGFERASIRLMKEGYGTKGRRVYVKKNQSVLVGLTKE